MISPMSQVLSSENKKKGFTLLELLIVIGILAILSVALILVLNPAETLRKSRDTQRLSDLSTIKTALGLYLTSVTTPILGGASVSLCLGTSTTTAQIWYSAAIADVVCATAQGPVASGTDVTASARFSNTDWCRMIGTTGGSVVDGTGWVPVNLSTLSGGSPISNYPLDPTNTIAVPTVPTSTDLVYRYTCQGGTVAGTAPPNVFELNAQLESTAYTVTEDKRATDGGDNTVFFEVGTSLRLMGGFTGT